MQITFTNGKVFTWTPDMGPSVNGGGNNMGWVIYAPIDFAIAYVDKGNNNQSGSFLVTTENGNPQFNISGYSPGFQPVKGSIKITKTVDGINIVAWAGQNGIDLSKLIVSFDLYDSNGSLVASKPVGDGNITFTGLSDGVYTVKEVLTDAGKVIFNEPAPREIAIANSIQYGLVSDFNYDGFYTIQNGYGGGYVLNWNGTTHLNNNGDIFPIAVVDPATGASYPSFCGNVGSTNFDENPGAYYIAQRMDRGDTKYVDFLKAYNYIENVYGNLNDYRPVTQIVTWYLLGAIDYPSDAFDNINWAGIEAGTASVKAVPGAKAIVEDVINNFKSFTGEGKIADVIYMVSKNYPMGDFTLAQPQYVPLYGKTEFKNTVSAFGSLIINASAYKEYEYVTYQDTKERNVWDNYVQKVWDIFQRNVWDILQGSFQKIFVPQFQKDVTNISVKTITMRGNYFDNNINVLQVPADQLVGYSFELAVSQNSSGKDPGLGVMATITSVNGVLGLTFDKQVFKSDYSLLLYSSLPSQQAANQANKHGNKVYDFTNGGNTVYVIFHNQGGLSFYTTGEYVFTGWKLLRTDTTAAVKVDSGASDYVAAGTGSSDPVKVGQGHSPWVITDVTAIGSVTQQKDYNAAMTLVVTDKAGKEWYNGAFNGQYVLSKLPAGLYTAVLSGNEIATQTQSKQVNADDGEYVINFGSLYAGKDSDVENPNHVVVTVQNKTDDQTKIVKSADVKNDITIDSVTLDPKDLGDKQLGSTDPNDPASIQYGSYNPPRS